MVEGNSANEMPVRDFRQKSARARSPSRPSRSLGLFDTNVLYVNIQTLRATPNLEWNLAQVIWWCTFHILDTELCDSGDIRQLCHWRWLSRHTHLSKNDSEHDNEIPLQLR